MGVSCGCLFVGVSSWAFVVGVSCGRLLWVLVCGCLFVGVCFGC